MPTYSAPYETVSSPCTGQPGAVCCGSSEYTLTRDQTQQVAFKMWTARINGTSLRDGSVPSNFRSAGATLTVTSGFYSATVNWPNYFYQKIGDPSSSTISASIELQMDTQASSFNDLILDLMNNYTLLVPADDPTAPGEHSSILYPLVGKRNLVCNNMWGKQFQTTCLVSSSFTRPFPGVGA